MNDSTDQHRDFLARTWPFEQLSPSALNRLAKKLEPLAYRTGQPIFTQEQLPYQLAILYKGRVRLVVTEPHSQMPVNLQLLKPAAVFGWVGLLRGIPCETAIAASDDTTICLTLPAAEFLDWLKRESALKQAFRDRISLAEIFTLLAADRQRQAKVSTDLKLVELATQAFANAVVRSFDPNTVVPVQGLERIQSTASQPGQAGERIWFVSSGIVNTTPAGHQLKLPNSKQSLRIEGLNTARLVGLLRTDVSPLWGHNQGGQHSLQIRGDSPSVARSDPASIGITSKAGSPPSQSGSFQNERVNSQASQKRSSYPYFRGSGPIEGTLACFQMLCQYLSLPFRKDMIERVLKNGIERNNGNPSLELCAAVADLMGLKAQLVDRVSKDSIAQLKLPALIRWQDSVALLYELKGRKWVVGVPGEGVLRKKQAYFLRQWQAQETVLLLQPTKFSPSKRFGLQWFLPALSRYRWVLIEVLIASFFVQLFSLAHPLTIQVIIDRVINNNSMDTLQVLGILLVGVAIFEAVLSNLRNTLFVDTTNRIDLSLGEQIIDHLLRLPLHFFDRRPVGELSSRINELENIRQFLTGTALTVVLDSVFSVLYIVVMVFYSWRLTLVALATIPLFIILTLIFSPLRKRLLRRKAERNAQTQSHLVEVLSGIQTVKAQNIELRSRWQWQERYERYISAGFNVARAASTAATAGTFFNKFSALLVLWVGAALVLQGELTLGQLIAFRIISGYVTSPLLRLAQLWQNVQETTLSLERLSDIIDTPQEADEHDRQHMPMPPIQGNVRYENVCFSFTASGPQQLKHITLNFPAGQFVGVVGPSGSGKSTLMKLLPRLYDLNSGHILIDDRDISKVELYSLRQQIGIVPQDSLLFDGTVRDNIALTQPNATDAEIIEAAKIADAHDFIEKQLPDGYNSRVGERGSALSGGQRQRIAIARTVLQRPRLLILDEATSALDYNTERQVCENLIKAFEEKTVFFITHRLNIIRQADTILMMADGRAVEEGTHQELMAREGSYYSLYRQQDTQL